MVLSIRGKLPPFRVGIKDFLEFIRDLKSSCEDVSRINVEISQYSFESSDFTDIENFLYDIHIPKVITELRITIFGKPSFGFTFQKDKATYFIWNATSMGQVVTLKDKIEAFFDQSKASKYLEYPLVIYSVFSMIGAIESIIGLVGSIKRTVQYPYAHLFAGFLALALSVYCLLSQILDKPESFSFVYSLLYIKEQPKGKIWHFVVGSIFLDIIVSILLGIIFTP